MSFRVLIVLFLIIPGGLFAQKNDMVKLSELKTKIRHATYYDSTTVFKLGRECIQLARKLGKENEVGLVYQYYGNFNYFSGNIESAKKYYRKSIDIARKTKDFQLKNSTEIRLAYIETEIDVFKGENLFRKLLKEAKRYKFIENQIEIYNGLGIMYETRLQDDKAVQCYHQGLRISEKYDKDYFTGFLLNNLGLLKFENKQYNEARKDLERALVLATKSNEPRLRFNILNNLGLVNKELGNVSASIQHYKQTVIEAKKIGFPSSIVVAYVNLASSYLDDENIREASNCVDSASALISPKLAVNFHIAVELIRGLVSIRQKNFGLTEKCISIASRLLKNYQDQTQLPELISLKSELAAAKGDFKQAYTYEKQFHEISDSLREISSEQELAAYQTIFGKERMESELTSLHQKNKILETENALKNLNIRSIILLSVSILFLALLIVYVIYVRKSRKVKSVFSQKLIERIDDERSRISKDLHDDIGQSLAVVKSKLNLYSTGKIDKLDGVEVEIGGILEQTRVLSHQLHPTALEKIGLERSLNALLQKTQAATNMVCSLDYRLSDLSLEISSQFYRIVQECVANTIKHASATALKVSCYTNGDEVIMEYRDNGIGFNETDSMKSGLGLQTIKERVLIAGGKLDLKSGTNKGVLIKIVV